MNARTATPPDAGRRARHLGMCEELAELGMGLARAAAREAMRELEAPLETRMPGMGIPPACPAAEPGVLFTRLSRAVRQAIQLEARIAGGAFDIAPQAAPVPSAPPAATTARPKPSPGPGHDRPQISTERLEDDLAGDANRSIPDILATIREELGTVADLGQTPDFAKTIFPGTPRQSHLSAPPHRAAPFRQRPKPS